MRWSEKLHAEGVDIVETLAAIRRKEWITVQEAEILVDLPIKSGYRLIETGEWSTVAKQLSERIWRIYRPGLEVVPGQTEDDVTDDGRGYVKVPRLVLQQYKREISALRSDKDALAKQVRSQAALLHRLLEGVEGGELTVTSAAL
jgi:hypothetical protein